MLKNIVLDYIMDSIGETDIASAAESVLDEIDICEMIAESDSFKSRIYDIIAENLDNIIDALTD